MVFQLIFSLILLIPVKRENQGLLFVQMPLEDSLTVYVFLHDECVISQFFTPELTRLYDKYKTQKVGFVGYFPNTASTSERIETFGKSYQLKFPLLEDYSKDITRKFGITITPEVAVVDHRTGWQIYRGRIDDSYVRVGKRKIHPQHYDLEDTIELWLSNASPQLLVQTQAIGCFISFTD